MIRSRTIIAIPPGWTIKEQIEDRGMTQKELAARTDMTEKHISRLINGEVALTQNMALRLEMVLGLPARFWNGLEAKYREDIQKVTEENDMDEDKEIVKNMKYAALAKVGWLKATRDKTEQVYNVRKFFEVVKLTLLEKPDFPGIVYRKVGGDGSNDYILKAFAQKAKIEARSIKTSPINIERLKALLPEIRTMTKKEPEIFCGELCEKMAACGIALVFLPHIEGSFLHGATFYDGAKIVMSLTVRGKDADRFWFSLFHEIGHIILGHIGKLDDVESIEKEADSFARDTLIPPEDFAKLISSENLTRDAIKDFAKEIGIDAGIVVGRLQKEGYLNFNQQNDMKTKYELAD